MATVGVAGGTGSLGRAVVEAIKATGNHESNPTLEAEIGVLIVVIDYTNIDVLRDALECNEIDNWTIPFKEEHAKMIPPVPAKLLAIKELSRSNLEYTVFYCGLFLDYLGFNGIKSYLPPSTLVMDFPHNMAAIQETGIHPYTEKLAQGQITKLPGHVPAYAFVPEETLQGLFAGLELLLVDGLFDLNPNSKLINSTPDIQLSKAKDVLEAAVKALEK
ncbi:hypothetical protein NM208_g598 [Fusarium decemcellulare]|uniref:Uncharacterized protein n=1 Tax=Fusarium decemcellulare TaxID=57161 RepID=A0ACC1SYQ2_9HYPO|nr:hypothetical protein NM208_g598 [Fusarium decemcellulare]